MIHGLRNNKEGAVNKFEIAKKNKNREKKNTRFFVIRNLIIGLSPALPITVDPYPSREIQF